MKKISIALAVIGAATGVAYLTKKMMDKTISDSKDRMARGISKESTNKRNEYARSNESSSQQNNDRTQKMYKDLGMTEEQRKQYEHDYRTVMNNWDSDNPNKLMHEKMKMDKHNSALQSVLNEAQYSIYREWEKKNPN